MSFVTIKAGLRSTPIWKGDQLIFDNISVEGSMVELTGRFTCFGSNIKSYCKSKPEICQLRATACDCTESEECTYACILLDTKICLSVSYILPVLHTIS